MGRITDHFDEALPIPPEPVEYPQVCTRTQIITNTVQCFGNVYARFVTCLSQQDLYCSCLWGVSKETWHRRKRPGTDGKETRNSRKRAQPSHCFCVLYLDILCTYLCTMGVCESAVCQHTSTHTRTYVHTHERMRAHAHTPNTHPSLHVCTFPRAHVNYLEHSRVRVHARTHAHEHARTHARMHTHTHAHTHTHTVAGAEGTTPITADPAASTGCVAH